MYDSNPIRFLNYGENFGYAFICPRCGEDYTHHFEIETFDRSSEDSKTGWHCIIRSGYPKVDSCMSGNPSSRRDGIRIKFYCEFCEDENNNPYIFNVDIHQHKGQTFVFSYATTNVLKNV